MKQTVSSKEKSEWDDFWKKEESNFGKSIVNFARKHFFSKMIAKQLGDYKNKTVLEAGSGSCESLIHIIKKAKKVTGLDNAKSAINLGYENFRKAHVRKEKYQLILGDIFKIPFPDNSFDIVFNAGVIEHFDSIKPIKEMLRVTKQGGKIVILVPAENSLFGLAFKMLRSRGTKKSRLRKLYPWEDHKFYTKKTMRKELISARAKGIRVTQPFSLFGIYIKGIAEK